MKGVLKSVDAGEGSSTIIEFILTDTEGIEELPLEYGITTEKEFRIEPAENNG